MDPLARYNKNCSSQRSRYKVREGFDEAIRRGIQSFGKASDGVPGLLYVAPSGIPGAGKGVFASRLIEADEILIMPMGEIVYYEDQSDAEKAYSFEILGYPELSMQFSDDSRCNVAKYFNAREDANAVFYYYGALPIIRSKEVIPQGGEIFLAYVVENADNE